MASALAGVAGASLAPEDSMKWLMWAALAAAAVLIVDDVRLRGKVAALEEKLETEKEIARRFDTVSSACFQSLYSCRDTVEGLSTHTTNMLEVQARTAPGILRLAQEWKGRRGLLLLSVQDDLKEIRNVASAASGSRGSRTLDLPRETALWPHGG